MHRRSRTVLALLGGALGALALLLAGACGGEDESPPPTPTPTPRVPAEVSVVTTSTVFADFIRTVGGPRVEVLSLVPPGENPHAFLPTEEGLARLAVADLILFNGLGLEPSEELLFEEKRPGAQMISYAKDVPSPTQEGLSAFEAGDNPHLWLNPILALTYVDTTWDSLSILDGEGRDFYRKRGRDYQEELLLLDSEIQSTLAAIPPERRKLVLFHDSFHHFADRYSLEVVAFAAADPAEGPGPDAVRRLVEAVRREGVPAVFAEVGFDPAVMEAVAEEAGVQLCTLYSDTLDDQVAGYLEMMRFNAQELARCLGGE